VVRLGNRAEGVAAGTGDGFGSGGRWGRWRAVGGRGVVRRPRPAAVQVRPDSSTSRAELTRMAVTRMAVTRMAVSL
jgi:hypothetical protein